MAAVIPLSKAINAGQERDAPYSDAKIDEIREDLARRGSRYAEIPRWYIILSSIGHECYLDSIYQQGLTDNALPISEPHIPSSIPSPVRERIIATQAIIQTETLYLEKEDGKHLTFEEGDIIPYESEGWLGRGRYGSVEKVFSFLSRKHYAKKKMKRSSSVDASSFEKELHSLKIVKHRHIVKLVASYTGHEDYNIIMSPLAEQNLRSYLTGWVSSSPKYELRGFFGCLVGALRYLHDDVHIRHKDIKPENILLHRGRVYLADFGLALDFSNDNGGTTSGHTEFTWTYAAPEILDPKGRRNTSSDIVGAELTKL